MTFDPAKYPPNWRSEIRPRILARAGELRNDDGMIIVDAKCEWCHVTNGHIGHRDKLGTWLGECGVCLSGAGCDEPRPVKIVLTIAHIDQDTTNNDDSNLAALCQRCHLRHDAKQHAVNAAITRRAKRLASGQQAMEIE